MTPDAQPQQDATGDDTMAFICACKGEPYTEAEWKQRVDQLKADLDDALDRLVRARTHPSGTCPPARFDNA